MARESFVSTRHLERLFHEYIGITPKKLCNGCNLCEGKVFHAPEGGACPIYDCVKNHKGLPDCGQCGEVPCKIWFVTRDPKLSEEEFNENVLMRVQMLRKLQEE